MSDERKLGVIDAMRNFISGQKVDPRHSGCLVLEGKQQHPRIEYVAKNDNYFPCLNVLENARTSPRRFMNKKVESRLVWLMAAQCYLVQFQHPITKEWAAFV